MDQGAVGGVCVITMETAPPDESGAGDGVKADEDELTLGAEGQTLRTKYELSINYQIHIP